MSLTVLPSSGSNHSPIGGVNPVDPRRLLQIADNVCVEPTQAPRSLLCRCLACWEWRPLLVPQAYLAPSARGEFLFCSLVGDVIWFARAGISAQPRCGSMLSMIARGRDASTSGTVQQVNLCQAAESFSLHLSTAIPMIPEPYEPFDSNRKEDTIFLLGSMFIVTFLFLL